MAKNGIDVSRWQGEIDWSKVNIDFCIAQGGYGRETSQKYPFFEKNYAGCKSRKIPFGAYWYSYATTVADAYKEAEVCYSVIKDYKYDYPIIFNIEEPSQAALPKETVSQIIDAFCSTLKAKGYYVMVQSNASFLSAKVDASILKKYDTCVAAFNTSSPNYSGEYGLWHYSCTGSLPGVNTDVNLMYSYKDYPIANS